MICTNSINGKKEKFKVFLNTLLAYRFYGRNNFAVMIRSSSVIWVSLCQFRYQITFLILTAIKRRLCEMTRKKERNVRNSESGNEGKKTVINKIDHPIISADEISTIFMQIYVTRFIDRNVFAD